MWNERGIHFCAFVSIYKFIAHVQKWISDITIT